MDYSDYVNLYEYDSSIVCHPFIDACNGSILFRLFQNVDPSTGSKHVLDAGCGTGQVARLLRGIPNILVEGCDIDPEAKGFFSNHPELYDLPFHEIDIVEASFPRYYDAIICRGVYHHIPKDRRPKLIENLCRQASCVIFADEGIQEYDDEKGRLHNCKKWYDFVINESRRRGLEPLARMESSYLEHERLRTSDDGGDFKESPECFVADARKVGLAPVVIDRIGPWGQQGGGFYTALFSKQTKGNHEPK